ncbi:MAG: serine hydrolase [Chryseotalea sp. WA131a]|nr:MAG: serine hydrolase [Chryseotalea sp. WA131a]
MSRLTHLMRKGILSIALLSLLAISWFPLYAQNRDHFTINDKKINTRSFDQEIERIRKDILAPGLGIAIIDNNKIVYDLVYGYKVNSDTASRLDKTSVFELASLSKPFLSYVALKLADEGKLDLDKPVYQYLENTDLDHDERYKLITPRMILNHSSGIENWRDYNNPDVLEILATPGTKFIYSGEGYVYLSRAIARILKKPYEEYIDEMVLRPLKLESTFTKFTRLYRPDSTYSLSPGNYLMGHNALLDKTYKQIYFEPDPAGANMASVADYARFLLFFLKKGNLSEASRRSLFSAGTGMTDKDPGLSMNPAFIISITAKDTIIAHGGSNDGFKHVFYYSKVSKRGFVLFTNYDRGYTMAKVLNEMTAGIDITPIINTYDITQYPSVVPYLLKTYLERGSRELLKYLSDLKHKKEISEKAFTEVALAIKYRDKDLAIQVLNEAANTYPSSTAVQYYLAYVNMESCNFETAKFHFSKVPDVDTSGEIKRCNQLISEISKRTVLVTRIDRTKVSQREAEDFNGMCGVDVEPTMDTGGGDNVGYLDATDWLSYSIDPEDSGAYQLSFRVASPDGGGKIKVLANFENIAVVDIPKTDGWQTWKTVTINVDLAKEKQTLTLQVVRDGFNLNWISFQKLSN